VRHAGAIAFEREHDDVVRLRGVSHLAIMVENRQADESRRAHARNLAKQLTAEDLRAREQRDAEFSLAATRVVMESPSCEVAAERAAWLVALFGDRLPRNFAQSVDQRQAEVFAAWDRPLTSAKGVYSDLSTTFTKKRYGSWFDRQTGVRVPRDVACEKLRKLRAAAGRRAP
jgi:hypothetical protein